MTKATAAELLDLVIDRAPKLRKAGVASVDLESLSFELLALEPEAPPAPKESTEDEEDRPRGPLDDPDTFSRRRVPGNQRRERSE